MLGKLSIGRCCTHQHTRVIAAWIASRLFTVWQPHSATLGGVGPPSDTLCGGAPVTPTMARVFL
jgi:hypothetical protein